MRVGRLLFYLLVCGLFAGFAGGFLAAWLVALLGLGTMALLPPGWMIGVLGGLTGLKLATLPCAVLGGLLWRFRVRGKWAWAGTGALAGLGLFGLVALFPAADEMAGDILGGPEGWKFLAVGLPSGAFAALVFRVLLDSLTAFDDSLAAD